MLMLSYEYGSKLEAVVMQSDILRRRIKDVEDIHLADLKRKKHDQSVLMHHVFQLEQRAKLL